MLFSWLVYLAFLTYIPFIDYYFENEVNIQYLVPDYALFLIIIIFLIIPFGYFFYFDKAINKFKKLTLTFGILFLIISSVIIFGLEIFNHQKRMPLENICYQQHSANKEMLECCLNAEYIWQEGFSYLSETPVNCKKYMNWND
ncbi:hypothetical protein OBA27_03150 [Pelagibacteraceae bacterium]|nr:hypothetical protein [Pelagibacteraceae bacterium]